MNERARWDWIGFGVGIATGATMVYGLQVAVIGWSLSGGISAEPDAHELLETCRKACGSREVQWLDIHAGKCMCAKGEGVAP